MRVVFARASVIRAIGRGQDTTKYRREMIFVLTCAVDLVLNGNYRNSSRSYYPAPNRNRHELSPGSVCWIFRLILFFSFASLTFKKKNKGTSYPSTHSRGPSATPDEITEFSLFKQTNCAHHELDKHIGNTQEPRESLCYVIYRMTLFVDRIDVSPFKYYFRDRKLNTIAQCYSYWISVISEPHNSGKTLYAAIDLPRCDVNI